MLRKLLWYIGVRAAAKAKRLACRGERALVVMARSRRAPTLTAKQRDAGSNNTRDFGLYYV